MSLQAALKTLEEMRADAAGVRDLAGRALRKDIGLTPIIYDYWAGREAALADAIAELTKGVRPISQEEAAFMVAENIVMESNLFGKLGAQLEADHAKHRTVENDLAEDR